MGQSTAGRGLKGGILQNSPGHFLLSLNKGFHLSALEKYGKSVLTNLLGQNDMLLLSPLETITVS